MVTTNRKITHYREWLAIQGKKRGQGSWDEFCSLWSATGAADNGRYAPAATQPMTPPPVPATPSPATKLPQWMTPAESGSKAADELEQDRKEYRALMNSPTARIMFQRWMMDNGHNPYLGAVSLAHWKAYKAFRLEVGYLESLHALQDARGQSLRSKETVAQPGSRGIGNPSPIAQPPSHPAPPGCGAADSRCLGL